MSLLGLALVLTAAFCHATWNYFVKRINGGPELVWLFSALSCVLYLPLAVLVLVVESPEFGPMQVLFMVGTAVLHLGYFLLLQQGYRVGDLSVVYPTARATGPLLSTAFAVAVLGEHLSAQTAAGGLTIVAGVLFLGGGLRRGARQVSASLAYGLAVGAFIGSYTVWDAYAVTTLKVPPLILDYASILGRGLMMTPYAWRRRAAVAGYWRDHRGAVFWVALFSPLAYILVLYALTFTPVVYVAPAREVSVLLTVLMGTLLLGEGRLGPRLGLAGVILAGMVLLVSG